MDEEQDSKQLGDREREREREREKGEHAEIYTVLKRTEMSYATLIYRFSSFTQWIA